MVIQEPQSSSPSREFSFTISVHPSSIDSFDLSPADDIFFHGRLLPLNLIDEDVTDHYNHDKDTTTIAAATTSSQTKGRIKTKKLSSFWFTKWRKRSEVGDREGKKKKKTNKVISELTQLFKKYLEMVKPKKGKCPLSRRSHSFTEKSSVQEKQVMEGRRRKVISAPVSMQTSPTNSGNDLSMNNFPRKDDCSMEDLQAAIQAAIVHCKKSISVKNET
ncbi:hypothetical protein ACHQM5_024026 [Ranunculus cassubicifolius]